MGKKNQLIDRKKKEYSCDWWCHL